MRGGGCGLGMDVEWFVLLSEEMEKHTYPAKAVNAYFAGVWWCGNANGRVIGGGSHDYADT